MKKRDDRIQITELFMAKVPNDYSRCFYGSIKRLKDDNGNPYVFGKITVNQGLVCARGGNQDELGRKLDEFVLLVLDYGLHNDWEKSLVIAGTIVFLN